MRYAKDIVSALELFLATVKEGAHHRFNDLDIWKHKNTEVYIDQDGSGAIGITQGHIHLPHVDSKDLNIHVRFEVREIVPARKGFGGLVDLKKA